MTKVIQLANTAHMIEVARKALANKYLTPAQAEAAAQRVRDLRAQAQALRSDINRRALRG